jgi:taurine dioxygenase
MTKLAGVRPKTSADPMIDIVPTGEILGAAVNGMDLSQALTDAAFDQILRALGRYGVLRFPQQALKPAGQKAFASRFGSLEVHVAGLYQDPEHPEIMFLSNIVENGKPIGLADAGQDWHTDMSYNRVIALANVPHATDRAVRLVARTLPICTPPTMVCPQK